VEFIKISLNTISPRVALMAVKNRTVQSVGDKIELGKTSEANIFLDSTLCLGFLVMGTNEKRKAKKTMIDLKS
jgi:hypothetical protein